MISTPALGFLALAVSSAASPLDLVKRAAPPAGVPQYVLDYAPVVHLYSGDPYRPADIGAQVANTVPEQNFTALQGVANPLTLENLDSLNSFPNASSIYLTSKVDVTTNPPFLNGVLPDPKGETLGATSCVVVTVDKGAGILDAFYFYFYGFDFGGVLLGQNVGNHIGDWEHNAIRFNNSQPVSMWYSQHSDGDAYEFSAVTKQGLRPITYSANGSHANYVSPGIKDRADVNNPLPGALFNDYADVGPLWDPTANAYFVKYDNATQTFSGYDECTPLGWLDFIGAWGDQQYPNTDSRQQSLAGLAYKWTSGPTGPRDKGLGRKNICPDNDSTCTLKTSTILRREGDDVL